MWGCLTALLAGTGLAQVPATPAEEQQLLARKQLAQAVHALEVSLERLESAHAGLLDSLREAEAAAQELERAGRTAEVGLVALLRSQLNELVSVLAAQRGELQKLRDKLGEHLPRTADFEVGPIREQILAALRKPDLADARRELELLEKRLDAIVAEANNQAADQLLGLARHKLAEVLYRQGAALNRSSNSADQRRAIDAFTAAGGKFAQVLESADDPTTEEGSSLHASALFWRIRIEGIQYAYNRELYRRSPSSSLKSRYEGHRKRAEVAYEQLSRVHPEATSAREQGRRFVDLARDEVRAR